MDKRSARGKGFEHKRNGGNATEHIEIETSKSPRLVGIQIQGENPKRPRAWHGALGKERGAKGRPPSSCIPALLPSRLVAAQSLRLQLSRPGEVLVASRVLVVCPLPGCRLLTSSTLYHTAEKGKLDLWLLSIKDTNPIHDSPTLRTLLPPKASTSYNSIKLGVRFQHMNVLGHTNIEPILDHRAYFFYDTHSYLIQYYYT